MDQYYRHFRNKKIYRFVAFATIEATEEDAVVYQAMYGDRRYWIRTKTNFFEEVEHEGKRVPRFQKISEQKFDPERINQMSAAFKSLSAVTATLTDSAEELKNLAPDVDLLKDYISSGQWLKDFEADERGEIGTDVDRAVLSEDGLYNLMEDLDDLMHTFDELQDIFAADPDLELKLQEE